MLKEACLIYITDDEYKSLNPYFNGTCSKSHMVFKININDLFVLILILMEHAQRAYSEDNKV